MRTKSFFTFMLAVVTAICFTSCADDNDEGWRAVSAADYKVFTDAKAAFLNNPQNVGTPMYETLIYLTEKPQAVKAQEVEGGTNYEFYFSICNVSIAKGILDEVGYIVNTSMRSDATSHVAIGVPMVIVAADPKVSILDGPNIQRVFIQDYATRQGFFILYDAARHGVDQMAFNQMFGATGQGAVLNDAPSRMRYKTMVLEDGFSVSTSGASTVGRAFFFDLSGRSLVRGASVAYAGFNQPNWVRSAKK